MGEEDHGFYDTMAAVCPVKSKALLNAMNG